MTTESSIKAFITAVGTDWKNLWAKIGTGTLNTTATNLTAAINEVKTTADTAAGGSVADATTSTKGKVELATNGEALSMSDTAVVLTPSNLGSLRNVANGLAGLDGTGKVAAAQLPSYVDDVLEYANLAALPATGATGVLYVTLDTNREYRWGGSSYVVINPSPGSTDAVPEGSTNLYFTNARVDTRVAATVGDTAADYAAFYVAAKA